MRRPEGRRLRFLSAGRSPRYRYRSRGRARFAREPPSPRICATANEVGQYPGGAHTALLDGVGPPRRLAIQARGDLLQISRRTRHDRACVRCDCRVWPVPPCGSQQSLNVSLVVAAANRTSRVACDDRVGRHVRRDDAGRGDNRAVTGLKAVCNRLGVPAPVRSGIADAANYAFSVPASTLRSRSEQTWLTSSIESAGNTSGHEVQTSPQSSHMAGLFRAHARTYRRRIYVA